MNKLRVSANAVVRKLRNTAKVAAQSLFDIAKVAYVTVVILSYGVVLVFAGLSYKEGAYLEAIIATGLLATVLLVVQTMDRNSFRLHTWKFRVAWNTLIVGVAIHYSAIIIDVSFGAVFAPGNDSNWAIVAVSVQQAVLTRAAWVLVNEYRQSNAAQRKP